MLLPQRQIELDIRRAGDDVVSDPRHDDPGDGQQLEGREGVGKNLTDVDPGDVDGGEAQDSDCGQAYLATLPQIGDKEGGI